MNTFRKYLVGLPSEDREALLEYLRPSKVPFFRPPDPTPDFSEWNINALGKNSEDLE